MKRRPVIVIGVLTIILVYLWYKYDVSKTWSTALAMNDKKVNKNLITDGVSDLNGTLSGMKVLFKMTITIEFSL